MTGNRKESSCNSKKNPNSWNTKNTSDWLKNCHSPLKSEELFSMKTSQKWTCFSVLLKSVSLPFLYLGNAMCWSIQHSRNPSELCLPHDKRPYPSEALHVGHISTETCKKRLDLGRKLNTWQKWSHNNSSKFWWFDGDVDAMFIPFLWMVEPRNPRMEVLKHQISCHLSSIGPGFWVLNARKLLPAKRVPVHWKKPRCIYQSFQKEFKVGICQKLPVIGMYRLQESLILWEP